MTTIKVIIEKSSDYYNAYSENAEGIYGAGDTIEEAKQSALKGLELFKAHNKPENIPAILKGEYTIEYIELA